MGAIRTRLTPNALRILRRRYLAKDPSGRPRETPDQMFRRVAGNLSRAEALYPSRSEADRMAEAFYGLMARLEFLPNSPTLMNAGRELQQLAACFVLPVEDSLASIFEAVKHTALIHQSGGGTGFSFSRLRPRNDPVQTTSGIASGPVSFMRVFNTATEVIKQGGTRRGANMGVLRVDHPDILEFVAVKENPEELTNFNLSVAVTDAFMEAAASRSEFSLLHPRTGKPVRSLRADAVFDRMVRAAWKSGEPGLLFIDRINRDNPTPALGEIEATNPCGEQPLLPYEACNLGSVNLSRMTRRHGGKHEVDFEKLERTVRLGVRMLDNVIDMNRYPLPEIERMARGNRKIGLGVMGLADLLILLGLPYDSDEAVRESERVMARIAEAARDASEALSTARGVFPNYEGSLWSRKGRLMRNATTTTIAPAGTLSLIAGTSSGIEPLYGIGIARSAMEDMRLVEIHPLFVRAARRGGFYSRRLVAALSSSESIREIRSVPEEIRRIFVTAHDIPPTRHVRMQAAFQRHTDNAVSKTINFPAAASVADIRKAFLLAYREGCKGITVYRSGSRDRQVLTCTASNVQYC